MPSNLHCVLRLRVGGSARASSSSDDDGSGESSVASLERSSCMGHGSGLDVGAAGSGFDDDQFVLSSKGGLQAGRRSSVERQPVCDGVDVVGLAVAEDGGSTSSDARASVLAKEEVGDFEYCFPVNTGGACSSFCCPFHILLPGDPTHSEHGVTRRDSPSSLSRDARSALSASNPSTVGVDRDVVVDSPVVVKSGALSAPAGLGIVADSTKEESGGIKEKLPRQSVASEPVARRRSVVSEPVARRRSFSPSPVSILSHPDGTSVGLRMLGRSWLSPEPLSQEWSGWYHRSSSTQCWSAFCKTSAKRSPSVDANPPSEIGGQRGIIHQHLDYDPNLDSNWSEDGNWSGESSGGIPVDYGECFDDDLVQRYRYPPSGRQPMPSGTPMYNKFACKVLARGIEYVKTFRLRNIRLGNFVLANRFPVGRLVRFGTITIVHNFWGRKTNTRNAAQRVTYARQVGKNCHVSGQQLQFPLPPHVRVVYIDTCKLKWCSVDSVAFHSFAWPRSPKQAKSIARTLYANHCNWAEVLIVRGRRFSDHHFCYSANRVFENLLWNCDKLKRPYLVYKEGNGTTGGPIPRWFDKIFGSNQFC